VVRENNKRQALEGRHGVFPAMTVLTIQLPDWLLDNIRQLAGQHGYSVDQFLATAAAEKMAALRTLDYLRSEAAQGRREDFDRFLAAVPDREPDEADRLMD
jgi:hypothetical protein